MAITPDQARIKIGEAERRAGRRTLRNALIGLFLLSALVTAGVFVGYKIVSLTKRVVTLQERLTESTKTGRTIQLQVAGLVQQIADFTDPNSAVTKAQQAKTAGYLAALAAANQQALNDQTRRIGEMFTQCRVLPCATSTIARILGEPVPVPTFAGMAAVTTPGTGLSPALPPASPSPPPKPASSPRPAGGVTVCPGIQLPPVLNCP